MVRNKTRKVNGGRIGIMNPTWGGKNKPSNRIESILNLSESLVSGGGYGVPKPMTSLPAGISLGPLTRGLKGGKIKLKKTRKNKLKFEI